MAFVTPADYAGPSPEKLLSLRRSLEPHSFHLVATGFKGRPKETLYVVRDENGQQRKFGYYNGTVDRDGAVVGYHSAYCRTKYGKAQNGIQTGTEREFTEWFCGRFNCDETALDFHFGSGSNKGWTHPEILDLAVALRVLLSDAGIEAEGHQAEIKSRENVESGAVPDADESDETEAFFRTVADGQSLLLHSKLRKDIENYAMRAATDYFESQGYVVDDHSIGHSYDLHCSRNGETVLIEVKGTKSVGKSIFLTPNEVTCAREKNMILFVLHSIKVDENRGLSGGERVIIEPWQPADEDLKPVLCKYEFPKGRM